MFTLDARYLNSQGYVKVALANVIDLTISNSFEDNPRIAQISVNFYKTQSKGFVFSVKSNCNGKSFRRSWKREYDFSI